MSIAFSCIALLLITTGCGAAEIVRRFPAPSRFATSHWITGEFSFLRIVPAHPAPGALIEMVPTPSPGSRDWNPGYRVE